MLFVLRKGATSWLYVHVHRSVSVTLSVGHVHVSGGVLRAGDVRNKLALATGLVAFSLE